MINPFKGLTTVEKKLFLNVVLSVFTQLYLLAQSPEELNLELEGAEASRN